MNGNYYNPPYPPYDDNMQRRLIELQRQQQAYQQPGVPTLKGRAVTSIEEARAAQIDLIGINYFPCPAEGKIYEKSIDLNGLPVFRVYELARQPEPQKVVYAEQGTVDKLLERVNKLEQQLGGINHEPDAITRND